MTFRTRVRLLLPILALTSVVSFGSAQQPAATINLKNAPLDLTIPVDPLITVGTLPNGLRYYVRENKLPQARAELRLVVKAGSVLEDEDQRGLAHFVEHMAFNGTLHFPKQEISTFMQSLGMRFGAHVNAHTGFDETEYDLQIPTGNPAVMDRSLTILEDFARNVTFDAAEIDKERGVILEEWRLGLGAGERIRDAQMPVLLKGSRYADRSPIGKPEIIRNANYNRLKQFYADWYRPDMMAVVAVGDFNRAAVESQIRSRFGAIPAAASPKPRPAYTVPDQPGTIYSIITDPEVTQTAISVFTKAPVRDQSTVGAYRTQMAERLFGGMLSDRLDEIAQQPNAPFLAAQTSRGIFVRTAEVTSMSALVAQGGIERGLTTLFKEIDRVARFGFTATELDRQARGLQRVLENASVEKNKSPSGPLADEFIRNFLQGEPIPGIVYEYALNQRFLPEITLAEINALAKEWAPDRNRVVTIIAPEKDKATVPDAAKLTAAIAAAGGAPLDAYVDTVSTQPLLEPLPTPGRIATTSSNAPLGITEWRLSNGVRVVLKPTNFKEDEILFRAISPGGTSLAPDRDFIPAETADAVVAQGGLGQLRSLDLGKALAGRTVSVRAEIGDTEEGLGGGSSRKDLETMFQLIYLTFTAPRPDPVAFGVYKEQLKVALANQDALPDTAFEDALTGALTQNHPRALPLKAANVDQMNLDRSLAFYKERFADASDFTFVFVGSFELAAMRPLVERYLASLPSLHRNESARDVGIQAPAGVVEKQVRKGIEPKSQVTIVFPGSFENDEMHRLTLRAMGEMLSGNLHRTLREDLGGTYGVSVQPRFTKRPKEEYRIAISFACDPARAESLVKTTFDVIAEFKANGPSDEQVADARQALMRDFETNSQRNSYLLSRLVSKYDSGESIEEVFDIRASVNRLTPALIRDAARTYLDTRRYVEVRLLPEVRTP
jgi:zinc protease